MAHSFAHFYHAIGEWAKARGIEVKDESLPPGKAGEFNGPLVKMNCAYDLEERSYYLIHALGSIILWSLNKDDVAQMFSDLRDAKGEKTTNPTRFEKAIAKYRDFETAASELAVWLLDQLGQQVMLPSYTNFMRADLEAMTEFHLKGVAPVWSAFFNRWNHEIASGQRQLLPFVPKPILPFRAVKIEKQEILQRQVDYR
jgi:hypothetical protein